jgi:hypothetical protein
MTTESAARTLREELCEIAAIEACAGCECLLGVLAQALADLRRLPGDEARDAEADLRRVLAADRQGRHTCLECDPCLPVEPYRRFRATLTAAGVGAVAEDARVAEPGGTADRRADSASAGCPGCLCDGCG